jgi:hypothetical protein
MPQRLKFCTRRESELLAQRLGHDDAPAASLPLERSDAPADTRSVNTPLRNVLKRGRLAALAIAVAVVPIAAGPADAATKHRRHKAKHATTKTVTHKRAAAKPAAKATAPAATPVPTAAPAATPAMTSVISIGGYVLYNLTYAEAVEAYAAAVAAAPAGYTPPPVTSVSVTTTVGGTAGNG